jgi:hypothetical protein
MRLLPLALSFDPACFPGEIDARGQIAGSCRFCGHPAVVRQERIICTEVGSHRAKDDAAPACAFCHLVRHLERAAIDREAILIWLPEMTQAALNRVAWRMFRTLVPESDKVEGVSAARTRKEPTAAAAALHQALRDLACVAAKELGTSSPSELGEVLLKLPSDSYSRRAQSLGGIRLLPLGLFFIEGRDVFASLFGRGHELARSNHRARGEDGRDGERQPRL